MNSFGKILFLIFAGISLLSCSDSDSKNNTKPVDTVEQASDKLSAIGINFNVEYEVNNSDGDFCSLLTSDLSYSNFDPSEESVNLAMSYFKNLDDAILEHLFNEGDGSNVFAMKGFTLKMN